MKRIPRSYSRTGTIDDLPDDLIVANCARCNHLLWSRQNTLAGWYHIPLVAGRVFGRPYCGRCLPVARTRPLPPSNRFAIPPSEE